MAKSGNDLLQGTLDLLVLRAVRDEARHGWGIQQRINQIAPNTLSINQGSLYPALIRLEKKGYLAAKWGVSENGRRAKFYTLTSRGLAQMEADTDLWREYSSAINRILKSV